MSSPVLRRQLAKVGLGIGLTWAVLGYACFLNFTPSIDAQLLVRNGQAPQRGGYVRVCPPAAVVELAQARGWFQGHAGACERGLLPVTKPVVALAGDTVRVSEEGVSVNGHLLPNTKPVLVDRNKKPLPQLRGTWRVAPGELWVVSDFHKNSLDSRYFGPVEASNAVSLSKVF